MNLFPAFRSCWIACRRERRNARVRCITESGCLNPKPWIRYVQPVHGSLVVTKIEKLVNDELEEKFLRAKMDLKSGALYPNMQQLWHGSGVQGVDGIPRSGFRIPDWSDSNMSSPDPTPATLTLEP